MFSSFCVAEDDRPIVQDQGKADVAKNRALPTIWLAGDSTVKTPDPHCGWGQELGKYLDAKKVNLVNRAVGGRSSYTFTREGKFRDIVSQLQQGDWVMIQFGHNDVGSPGEASRFRGTLKGAGQETRSITMPDGSIEEVHTYGWYLREMARAAKAKGAFVILCSPIPHKNFDKQGQFVHDWAEYRATVEQVAKEENVAYLDLAHLIGTAYEKESQATVEAFFSDARTHTNKSGADFNARCVIHGLKNFSEPKITEWLNAEGAKIPQP